MYGSVAVGDGRSSSATIAVAVGSEDTSVAVGTKVGVSVGTKVTIANCSGESVEVGAVVGVIVAVGNHLGRTRRRSPSWYPSRRQ